MAAEVVSWAGPLERADQALNRATDLFEKKLFTEGLEEMLIMQAAMDQAVEFIRMVEFAPKPQRRMEGP